MEWFSPNQTLQQTGDAFFTFSPQQLGRVPPCVSRLLSFVFVGFVCGVDMRNMIRFSLLLCVGSVLFFGAGCGPPKEAFVNTSGRLPDGTSYYVLWRNGDVEFIVFCSSKITLKTGPMTFVSSDSRRDTPSATGISLIPKGLFVDGVAMNTAGPNKVFVVQPDRTIRAIRVVQEDLESLSRPRIERIAESPSWPYFREQVRVERE